MNYRFLNCNKEKFIKFCDTGEKYVSIFSKPWWLECVSSGDWDVICADLGGKTIAFHPYYFVKEEDKIVIRKAPLTQNNGIIFNTDDNLKYQTRLLNEKKATELVIQRINELKPKSYRQYFHYSFTDWLPFYWNSFTQTTRYTYVIDSSSIDDVWAGMSSKLRNEIRNAATKVIVEEELSIDGLYEIVKMTFGKQGLEVPYSCDLLKTIDSACLENNSRHIFVAKDINGNICSCIYLVEDEKSVYYLISGSDPQFKTYNSLSLLIMKGIEYALKKGKIFDFEGSMKQNIEKHFAQFGAKQMPYMDIKKDFFD